MATTGYFYFRHTMEFTHSAEFVGDLPDDCTTVAPGAPTPNIAYVWDGDSSWVSTPDYRGLKYRKSNGEPSPQTELGNLDDGFTNLAPADKPNLPTNYTFTDGAWVLSDSNKRLKFNVRSRRNQLLSDTDWSTGLDVPNTPTSLIEFSKYRQWLRDIPSQAEFPSTIVWPDLPSYVKQSTVEDAASKNSSIDTGNAYAIAHPLA